MTEREKVIKGLECCIKRNPDDKTRCGECPYDGACLNRLKADALTLLKAQEPRVMTSTEVEAWVMIDRVNRTPIAIEVRDKFIAWIVSDEYYDLPECDLSGEFYNKTWRCWTSYPTDEQRGAVAWLSFKK